MRSVNYDIYKTSMPVSVPWPLLLGCMSGRFERCTGDCHAQRCVSSCSLFPSSIHSLHRLMSIMAIWWLFDRSLVSVQNHVPIIVAPLEMNPQNKGTFRMKNSSVAGSRCDDLINIRPTPSRSLWCVCLSQQDVGLFSSIVMAHWTCHIRANQTPPPFSRSLIRIQLPN